jgi:hypothetical protein
VILAAASFDLAAGAITLWWVLTVYIAPFAISFLAGGLVLIVASFNGGLRLLVAGLVLTAIAELEPVGGVTASAFMHQSLGMGSVLPLIAGALSIAGTLSVLIRTHVVPGTRRG